MRKFSLTSLILFSVYFGLAINVSPSDFKGNKIHRYTVKHAVLLWNNNIIVTTQGGKQFGSDVNSIKVEHDKKLGRKTYVGLDQSNPTLNQLNPFSESLVIYVGTAEDKDKWEKALFFAGISRGFMMFSGLRTVKLPALD